MANYLETKQRMDYLSGGVPSTTEREDDFYLDKNITFKKDDLKKGQNLHKIRRYMIGRKGVAYRNKSAEETVEDFVQHMRYFNANSVSTTGELRFINKADDKTFQTLEYVQKIT